MRAAKQQQPMLRTRFEGLHSVLDEDLASSSCKGLGAYREIRVYAWFLDQLVPERQAVRASVFRRNVPIC